MRAHGLGDVVDGVECVVKLAEARQLTTGLVGLLTQRVVELLVGYTALVAASNASRSEIASAISTSAREAPHPTRP